MREEVCLDKQFSLVRQHFMLNSPIMTFVLGHIWNRIVFRGQVKYFAPALLSYFMNKCFIVFYLYLRDLPEEGGWIVYT